MSTFTFEQLVGLRPVSEDPEPVKFQTPEEMDIMATKKYGKLIRMHPAMFKQLFKTEKIDPLTGRRKIITKDLTDVLKLSRNELLAGVRSAVDQHKTETVEELENLRDAIARLLEEKEVEYFDFEDQDVILKGIDKLPETKLDRYVNGPDIDGMEERVQMHLIKKKLSPFIMIGNHKQELPTLSVEYLDENLVLDTESGEIRLFEELEEGVSPMDPKVLKRKAKMTREFAHEMINLHNQKGRKKLIE